MSDVPLCKGKPIKAGWWWLLFSDSPGARYWNGQAWQTGLTREDPAAAYANYPVLRKVLKRDAPEGSILAYEIKTLAKELGGNQAKLPKALKPFRQSQTNPRPTLAAWFAAFADEYAITPTVWLEPAAAQIVFPPATGTITTRGPSSGLSGYDPNGLRVGKPMRNDLP